MPHLIHLDNPRDPRLADYQNVKERQLAAEFGAKGISGTPGAPHGKFYAEGRVVLHHLVRSRHTTLSVLTTPQQAQAIADELALLPDFTPIYTLPPNQMEQVVGFNIHRGLLAVGARHPPKPLGEFLSTAASHGGPLVVIENLANHDNVGAVFRNAAGLGAAGVILSPGCADPLYRKSLRVSVGLALRLPWVWADQWPDEIETLKQGGWLVLGLTPAGSIPLLSEAERLSKNTVALLLGAEGPGLTDEALKRVDARVAIPMALGVDSLNVATACAVALYEVGRRGQAG